MCGIAFFSGIHHLIIAIRLKNNPLHYITTVMSVATICYIILTLVEYKTTISDNFLYYLKFQTFFTAIFLISLLWFTVFYTHIKIRFINWILTVLLILFPLVRLSDPNSLIFSTIKGMHSFILPWGETIWLINATSTSWAYIYYSFILFFYIYIIFLIIKQIRNGDVKDGMILLVSIIIFILSNINDILIISFNLRGIFLSEFGFLSIVFAISLHMSNDITSLSILRQKVHDKNIELNAANEELIATNEELEAANEEFEAQNMELLGKEDLIIQSEIKYRKLFEMSGDGILLLKNDNIIDCNSQSLEIFGYSNSEDILQKKYYELCPEIQPDGSDSKNKLSKLLESALLGSQQRFHWLHLKQDNNPFHAEISLVSFLIEKTTYIQVTVRDISDMINAEKEKEEIQIQLVQAQKMEAIGTLAGGLAHDFNNILSGIIGSFSLIEVFLKKEKLKERENIEKYINIGLDSSNRSADMIKQLLTLSRKAEVQLVPLNISTSIKHIKRICENSLPKSIKLDIVEDDNVIMVMADPVQIEQVILNLCVNASHAMTIMKKNSDNQGGTLKVFCDRVSTFGYIEKKQPSFKNHSHCIKISVSDNGIGIAVELENRIFEPFFTTKSKHDGSGLGLAMSYTIIEKHGGFIDFKSEPEKGTTFNIYLPEFTGNKSSAIEDNKKNIIHGTGTILLIDDEVFILEIAREILQECGYNVLTANNPIEGIALYQKKFNKIDIVVVDLSMPQMSGLEVFKQLNKIKKNTLVILSSGTLDVKTIKRASDHGIKYFLSKPYSIEELSLKIDEALKNK